MTFSALSGCIGLAIDAYGPISDNTGSTADYLLYTLYSLLYLDVQDWLLTPTVPSPTMLEALLIACYTLYIHCCTWMYRIGY